MSNQLLESVRSNLTQKSDADLLTSNELIHILQIEVDAQNRIVSPQTTTKNMSCEQVLNMIDETNDVAEAKLAELSEEDECDDSQEIESDEVKLSPTQQKKIDLSARIVELGGTPPEKGYLSKYEAMVEELESQVETEEDAEEPDSEEETEEKTEEETEEKTEEETGEFGQKEGESKVAAILRRRQEKRDAAKSEEDKKAEKKKKKAEKKAKIVEKEQQSQADATVKADEPEVNDFAGLLLEIQDEFDALEQQGLVSMTDLYEMVQTINKDCQAPDHLSFNELEDLMGLIAEKKIKG